MLDALFEWDARKNTANQRLHGVAFEDAQLAFLDPSRVIARDDNHSAVEERYFCIGMVGGGILTVRYTFRGERIRIFGAGYCRKGRRIYEEENRLQE